MRCSKEKAGHQDRLFCSLSACACRRSGCWLAAAHRGHQGHAQAHPQIGSRLRHHRHRGEHHITLNGHTVLHVGGGWIRTTNHKERLRAVVIHLGIGPSKTLPVYDCKWATNSSGDQAFRSCAAMGDPCVGRKTPRPYEVVPEPSDQTRDLLRIVNSETETGAVAFAVSGTGNTYPTDDQLKRGACSPGVTDISEASAQITRVPQRVPPRLRPHHQPVRLGAHLDLLHIAIGRVKTVDHIVKPA
jgi:hypothetical protein